MPTLSISGLYKSFPHGFLGRRDVLHSISLRVQEGSVVGFIGMNGAGKSTLINLIMGFCCPDRGTILIENRPPSDPSSRANIGYLPEQPYLYENLTGNELIRFAGYNLKLDRKPTVDRGQLLLERLALDHAGDSLLRTYSKGMKQRLGLVLALLGDPDLYILDEPMSGLDPLGRQMVKELILEEKRRGKTIVFSSHILTDVRQLCDRLEIIRQGRIIFSGSVQQFTGESKDLEKRFIELHTD